MNWKQNTCPDFISCRDIFTSQHIKYTPSDILENLQISNFEQHLINVWSETVEMVNSGQLQYYDLLNINGNLEGFIIGYKESDTFNIRHFNAKDIENIPASIFTEFAKEVNVRGVTIRTRKGITEYNELIAGWVFAYKENFQGYDIYSLDCNSSSVIFVSPSI